MYFVRKGGEDASFYWFLAGTNDSWGSNVSSTTSKSTGFV